MIPNAIREFFNDIDSPWTRDFKKETAPVFEHERQLLDWIIHKSQWPYLPITLPGAPYADMLKEAMALEDLFVAHRSAPNELAEYAHRGWRSICLHGEAWNKTQHYHDYPENAGKTIDQIQYGWCSEIAERCPETTRYFKELFPYHNYQRLRYMWLEPHGYIQPHRDRNENFLQPMNIALNNPAGCVFKMHNQGYVPFKDGGSACLVDIGNLHAVWNNSNVPRIHMIAHAQWKPKEFTQIVIDSLKQLI
jgi:hypothetical protein